MRTQFVFLFVMGCLLSSCSQSSQSAPVKAADLNAISSLALEPTFESIKVNILEKKCLSCHSPGKQTSRIPLVTRENLLNSPLDIVIPGNAAESGIILAVTGAIEDEFMPPTTDRRGNPTGYTPLSDVEIATIREWINSGAKN